jgi:hypothetical protein
MKFLLGLLILLEILTSCQKIVDPQDKIVEKAYLNSVLNDSLEIVAKIYAARQPGVFETVTTKIGPNEKLLTNTLDSQLSYGLKIFARCSNNFQCKFDTITVRNMSTGKCVSFNGEKKDQWKDLRFESDFKYDAKSKTIEYFFDSSYFDRATNCTVF